MSQASEAEFLLTHPLLKAAFDRLEAGAIESAIAADLGDDEKRRNLMSEVRAIRSVRQQLAHVMRGHVKLPVDPEA